MSCCASSEIVFDAQTEVPIVPATAERQNALRRVAQLYVPIDPRPLVDDDRIFVATRSTSSRGGAIIREPEQAGLGAAVEIARATTGVSRLPPRGGIPPEQPPVRGQHDQHGPVVSLDQS